MAGRDQLDGVDLAEEAVETTRRLLAVDELVERRQRCVGGGPAPPGLGPEARACGGRHQTRRLRRSDARTTIASSE